METRAGSALLDELSVQIFGHLLLNHINFGHYHFLRIGPWCSWCDASKFNAPFRFFKIGALFEFLSVCLDSTNVLVDCEEAVSALELDVESGRLSGEQDVEFGSLLHTRKV